MADENDTVDLLVDGHVHLHDCYGEDDFLRSAGANFRMARQALGLSAGSPGVLALADVGGQDSFERLERWVAAARTDWRLRRTAEDTSLVVRKAGTEDLILIAGRQVRTRQGLEVLALGTEGPATERKGSFRDLGRGRRSGSTGGDCLGLWEVVVLAREADR